MDYTRPTPLNPNTPDFFTTGPGTNDGLSTPGVEGGTGLDPVDFSPTRKGRSSPEVPSSDGTLDASGNSLPKQVEAFLPPGIPGRNETRPLGQIEPLEPNSESSQSNESSSTAQSAIVAAEKVRAFMQGRQSPDLSEFYEEARGKAA